MTCSRKKLTIAFAVSGVILLVLGLVFSVGGVFAELIGNKVDDDVKLKPGSLLFKEWTKSSLPIYMQYFMFNLTNPEQVMDGAIPNVTQIGPYSYKELRSNKVINWTSDKSIVTFMPNRTFIFDPDTSCAGCNDKEDSFVTVNIPLLTVALKLKNTDLTNYSRCLELLQIVADGYEVKLFQSKTVYEILWGYTDDLLNTIVNIQTPECPGDAAKGASPFVQLQFNNTYYGISAVNSGQVDINELEKFTMWRGESHLSWWSDKYGNMINGTDGTQFAPKLSKDDTLYVFSPEICRSIYLNYESKVKVKRIELYRFISPKELFESGDEYPPNKGFCVPPGCLQSGLLNISLCQPMNPPVIISAPHFYQGNKSLLKTVNGLDPVKSAHESYLDVEPTTGIVMRVARRVQINVALQSVDTIKQTVGKFKPVFLPVMFVNESAVISEEKAKEFRSKVYGALVASKVVQYFLIALGLLFILAAVVLVFMTVSSGESTTSDEKKPLYTMDED